MKERCRNMNHSRSNVPVKYCPNCGEIVNATVKNRCSSEKHMVLLKNRSSFCHDCGKNLSQI